MTNQQPVPYRAESDPAWNTVAAGTAHVILHPAEKSPEVIVVSGPCPRCTHETVHTEPLVSYAGALGTSGLLGRLLHRRAVEAGSREVEVICACRATHPEAGEHQGCGASWVLHVEWSDQ
ncbi:hypothetical protein GCM10010260_72870 [Streptomyces filipinensis]|uniref:Uncharacterized protein n=1 Tax=Streptomyces filipinensis TaxID=66887 RepID=A0A918IIV4_9ACTN|nr:hypothetical protein [Streptomyces filipinensis]GGV22083.1 hypothetical protein GCM10010260_72870 [Streptomyces filipinensis]